jgi:glycerol uptake facilitator protein
MVPIRTHGGENPMSTYLAELIGTMILIILGEGVVANVVLKKSKGQNSGWIVIATAWGLAVALAVYTVGRISGAHLNPAITLALALIGSFPWSVVPGYFLSQLAGAFLGAVVVWLSYLPHWKETDDQATKLGVFATIPAIRNTAGNILAEMIGTAMLVFCVLAIGANAQHLTKGLQARVSWFSTSAATRLPRTNWNTGKSCPVPAGWNMTLSRFWSARRRSPSGL